MDLNKLSFNDGDQSIESFGRKPLENQLSIFGSKGTNHSCTVVRGTSYVKKWMIGWYAAPEIAQVADKDRPQFLEMKAGIVDALDSPSRVIPPGHRQAGEFTGIGRRVFSA